MIEWDTRSSPLIERMRWALPEWLFAASLVATSSCVFVGGRDRRSGSPVLVRRIRDSVGSWEHVGLPASLVATTVCALVLRGDELIAICEDARWARFSIGGDGERLFSSSGQFAKVPDGHRVDAALWGRWLVLTTTGEGVCGACVYDDDLEFCDVFAVSATNSSAVAQPFSVAMVRDSLVIGAGDRGTFVAPLAPCKKRHAGLDGCGVSYWDPVNKRVVHVARGRDSRLPRSTMSVASVPAPLVASVVRVVGVDEHNGVVQVFLKDGLERFDWLDLSVVRVGLRRCR